MIRIKDLQVYTSRMEQSMLDKLWWLDSIPSDIRTVYDFGCADGALLSAVHQLHPEYKLKGYDIEPAMVEAAQKRLPQASFSTFPIVNLEENSVLVASSVIHEIYSYSTKPERDMENIFKCGAKYIAIRDMFYGASLEDSDYEDVIKVLIREPKEKILEFEEIWGPLSRKKNLLHYLLKYRYVENWQREVRENYFPVDLDSFIERNSFLYNYKIVYREHYTLPYVAQRVREDFGIILKDKTHAKILLERIE